MELFSVTCITCRSKLKVRHESAIGQILACPKCNGMVQIEPPPGWKPPSKKAGPAVEEEAGVASEAVKAPLPRHPRPTASQVPSTAATSEEESLAPPGRIVAPHEAQARKWVLIGGAVLALLIIGFGLWSSLGNRVEPPLKDVAAVVKPTKSATRPVASSSPTPIPTVSPSPAPVNSTPTPSATAASSPGVAATGTPSGSPPPLPVASVSPTAMIPLPIPVASATPTATPPIPAATAKPSVIATVPPPPQPNPPPAVGPQIDLAARLADRFSGIAFEQTPLRQALETLSQLSTIRIQYDVDSLAAADVRVDEPVTLNLSDATVEEAIKKLTADRGLQFRVAGDQVVVFAPAKMTTAAATVTYPVEDLVGTDEAATKAVADLVRRFAVPDAWDEKWGGRLDVSAGKLEVTQQAAGQLEIAAFLDRLRLARGKTPKDVKATLATRFRLARELLETPVTMNFRPAATLPEITGRIEAATGATVLINFVELATQGYFGGETIGIAADKQPVERVLGALCDSRDWGWRIVGPKLIEITTRDAVRRRPYVEFYALPSPPLLDLAGPGWVTKIRSALADEAWRDTPGADPETAGDVTFDDISQRLIVRHHQSAHGRIERLLAENVKSPPATPAPKASATPSIPRPTATATGTVPVATPKL